MIFGSHLAMFPGTALSALVVFSGAGVEIEVWLEEVVVLISTRVSVLSFWFSVIVASGVAARTGATRAVEDSRSPGALMVSGSVISGVHRDCKYRKFRQTTMLRREDFGRI